MLGDIELLRSLLATGVNVDQETSRGRTAVAFAEKANRHGSHDGVTWSGKDGPFQASLEGFL